MVKQQAHEPILYLKIFLIVFFFAGAASLFYKGLVLVSNSTFRHETFNLLLLDRDAYIVHIDAKEKKLFTMEFPNKRSALINKGRIDQSAALGVLIDGVVTYTNEEHFMKMKNNFLSVSDALSFITNGKYKLDNINEYDLVKIIFLSHLTKDNNRDISESLMDNMKRFSDNKILDEGVSVQVINSTEIDGFGNRFATALKNVGYNVVALETGERQKSEIRSTNKFSESTGRIIHSLRVPYVESMPSDIVDITIVLGKDIVRSK